MSRRRHEKPPVSSSTCCLHTFQIVLLSVGVVNTATMSLGLLLHATKQFAFRILSMERYILHSEG